MRFIIIIFIILSNITKANIVPFTSFEDIEASKFNSNLDYINSILMTAGYSIISNEYKSGDVINKTELENLFNQLNNMATTKNESSFNQNIDSLEINQAFLKIENQAKEIIPQNCLEIISRDPSKIGQDGVYLIDDDGFDGIKAPYPVFCDMTTDGGGWTNIAVNNGPNIGDITGDLSALGISSSSTPNTILGGSLVSLYNPGSCTNPPRKIYINNSLLTRYSATRIKYNVKSYASGTLECGGIMSHSNTGGIIKYNSFSDGHLAACATYPNGFNKYTSSQDLHYSTTLSTNVLASLFSACLKGTAYLQINSIMVR